jgi:hypothetical protein
MAMEVLSRREHVCEWCLKQHVKYVQIMMDTTNGRRARVGCHCAGVMEYDLIAAKRRHKSAEANRRRERKSTGRNGNTKPTAQAEEPGIGRADRAKNDPKPIVVIKNPMGGRAELIAGGQKYTAECARPYVCEFFIRD